MKNKEIINLFQLIQMTVSSNESELDSPTWNEVMSLARTQAISGFIAQSAISCGAINSSDWQLEYYKQLKYYTNILVAQNELHKLFVDAGIKYSVLKGCAAAVYYPGNAMRTMGDIDFIVPSDQFEEAFNLMANNGYLTSVRDAKSVAQLNPRHACFAKHGVSYELHRIFADDRVNDCDTFNNLIKSNIENAEIAKLGDNCEFYKLPDCINGLVLLQHINQHIRGGVGLRQIIDWMMFVVNANADIVEFESYARKFGLWTLAINVTRMCQIYLGLDDAYDKWCIGADDDTCRELMQKIIQDGNFGSNDYTRSSMKSVMQGNRNPIEYFKRLQLGGLCRWEAAQSHPALRPFAWAYQLKRVVPQLLSRPDAIASIRRDIEMADQERLLLDKLGLM